jgi:hypothetical protein
MLNRVERCQMGKAWIHEHRVLLWGGCIVLCTWFIEAALHWIVFDRASGMAEHLFPSDPNEIWMRMVICALIVGFAVYAHIEARNLRELHRVQLELNERLNYELERAIKGFVPLCANCKSIRVEGLDPLDQKSWKSVEDFISDLGDAKISHGLCPKCAEALYGINVGGE